MEALGRVELPTNSLGNCCSIHLSYRATFCLLCFRVSRRPHVTHVTRSGGPGVSRTRDLEFRKLPLYPVELRGLAII